MLTYFALLTQMLNARSVEQQQLPTISVNVTAPTQQIRCVIVLQTGMLG